MPSQAPWRTPATPTGRSPYSGPSASPWRRPSGSSEADPSQLLPGEEEEPSFFSIPNALRVGGGVIGSVLGGAIGGGGGALAGSVVPGAGTAAGGVAGGAKGALIGGGIGAAAGEWLAELMEVRRKQRERVNPWQVATQGAIGAIPMGKIGTIASGAVKGAALGATATVGTRLAESDVLDHVTGQPRGLSDVIAGRDHSISDDLPSLSEIGHGALVGGVFGGAAAGIVNRFTRPRPPRTPDGPSIPPPGSQFRPAWRVQQTSFDPPPPPPPAGAGGVADDALDLAWPYQPSLPIRGQRPIYQRGSRGLTELLRRRAVDAREPEIPVNPYGEDLGMPLPLDEAEAAVMSEFRRPTAPPALTRPILPSPFDSSAGAIAQSDPYANLPPLPEGFDELNRIINGPDPTDFTRQPGAGPSLARPLVPSGLDVAPPSLDAPTGHGQLPDWLVAALDGADPREVEFLARPEGPYPSVTRPLVPSGLDALPPSIEQTRGPFPDALRGVLEPEAADLSRPPGPFPSLTRPLNPSGLDAAPPAITAPAPVDDLSRVLGEGGYAGPERRSVTRQTGPDVDATYQRMRDQIAAGRQTGSSANRNLGRRISDLEAAREAAAAERGETPLPRGRGEEAPAPPQPSTPGITGSTAPSPTKLGTARPTPGYAEVDASAIKVDPKTYQFKGGADAQGLTDRLKAVESWDPIAGEASPVILHERADGSLFVVDGHQRVGLAKRMQANGRPVPPLRAVILKESEGVTPASARRIGAMLNLQQGTGTATDVAKVLRQAPLTSAERARIPKDQTSGVKLRMGEDLAKLGDDAFLRVVNGQVHQQPARNEAYGAIVGRLIKDEAEQVSALQQLAQHAPENAYEAEQFVKAIQSAGFEHGTQTNLFGTQEVANSLAGPISKVMNAARRALQSEKSALGNAIRNEERLARRGNVLNREANVAGQEQAGALDQLLDAFGHTAGPVREVLKNAARQVQRGELTAAKAADQVLDALERERANLGSGVRPPVRPNDAAGGPPQPPGTASVAESEDILGQLARTLNRDTPNVVDEPPPLRLIQEAAEPDAPTLKELEAAGQRGMFGEEAPAAAPASPVDQLQPDPKNPAYAKVPFKVASDADVVRISETADYSQPSLERLPIKDLIATQDTVTRDVVASKLGIGQRRADLEQLPVGVYGRAPRNPGLPVVYRDGDKLYLGDGTHETVARMLDGETEVQALVYPTKPKTPAAAADVPPQPTAGDLGAIATRHEIRNPAKVTEISDSMKRVGWKGRPLLVIKDGEKETAWTGVHRLEAAKQAGLKRDAIPTVDVDAAKLREAGYDVDELTKLGKKARIEALRKAGQGEAADLLELERGAKAIREQNAAKLKRGTGLTPREKGTNPRSVRRVEELLDAGQIDEAEELLSKQIESQIETAFKRGAGTGGNGNKAYGGLPIDPAAMRELVRKHPETAWRATMAAIGGAAGWALDEDHPGRGAILGLMAGGSIPTLVKALQRAEMGGGPPRRGVDPVRVPRDPKKDIGLFELIGGTPERTIPEQFEKARPAFEKFLKALHEEHARTKAIIPQKRVQALRDRFVTPVITQIRKDAKLAADAKHVYKAKYITAFANRLAGHRTIGQRVVSAISKGKVTPDFVERRIAGSVYYVGTGFGVDTALQNLTQPVLALAHVPSKFVAQAYKDLATSPAAKRLVEGALLPLEKPADAIELTLGPFGRKIGKITEALDKIDPKRRRDPQMWLRMTDQKNREITYYAARKYAESQGLESAAADTWARQVMRKTQTEPGALGTNPFHAGPVMGSMRPFTKYPTAFTEHLVDLVKQADAGKNLKGVARIAGTVGGLALLGRVLGIDTEDLLISGGRPLGLDIQHPLRSLERVATGTATPATRGAFDLLEHLTGEADHELLDDAKALAVPRYPRKVADAIERFQESGTEGAHITRGPGGKVKEVNTPGETLLNLLGLRTHRQTERRHALADFYEEATTANTRYKADRRKAYEDLGEALDSGDAEAARAAMRRIGNVSAIRQFLKNRQQMPEERFFKTLPPAVRREVEDALRHAQELGVR